MDTQSNTSSLPGNGGEVPTVDLTGKTVGDFRVLRKLGQGGMGQVYLAEQVSLKRKVALKILRRDLSLDERALKRFEAEAQAVAAIVHPNIVQVYLIDQWEGLRYMALEYVEGRNLREFVARKGPPEPLMALSIMRQVASALQRASEGGLVHRDIKPENILLNRKGDVEVKVADFGLSRFLEGKNAELHLTHSGMTMGTPLYMSPEQVEGKPVDCRTDIYSFGITCYHMLTGQPPFKGSTAFEVALQHVRTEPAPLASVRPDLPADLCAIVHKMMAKDPAQRYQNGRELLLDIVSIRDAMHGVTGCIPLATTDVAHPVRTGIPAPSTRMSPMNSRRRRRAIAAALGLLLAAGVGIAVAVAQTAAERRDAEARNLTDHDGTALDEIAEAEEGIHLKKREEVLKMAVDRYLDPASHYENAATGVRLSLDLAVLYLDQGNLKEAENLFNRLAAIEKVPDYEALGRLGQAIMLGLRERHAESNLAFTAIRPGTKPFDSNRLMMLINANRELAKWIAEAVHHNNVNGINSMAMSQFFRQFLRPPTRRTDSSPPKDKP